MVKRSVRKRIKYGGLAIGMASASLNAARADTQAQDVLKKLAAVYEVKSFQGTIAVRQTGTTEENKPFNLSSVEDVQYKQPNLYSIKSSGSAMGGTQLTVCDGKEIAYFFSAQNQYAKQPLPVSSPNLKIPLLSLLGAGFDPQSGKLLPSITLAGKPAYVVQVTSSIMPLAPNAPAQEKRQWEQLQKMLVPFELVIDKQNFHLLRITRTLQGMNITKTLEITRQTLNPEVPDSVFVFTPPDGAKLAARKLPDVPGGAKNVGAAIPPPGSGRVSRGSGSPVPLPHASPGANGTGRKP